MKIVIKMVHEKYDDSKTGLESRKEAINREFLSIRPIWSGRYERNDCEYIFTILALIDYVIVLLGKKGLEELDITQYNVLVNFLNGTAAYLKNETASFSLCPETESCIPHRCEKLSDIMDLFLFIQHLGEKFRILPSTFSEDAYLEDFGFKENQGPNPVNG